MSFGELFRTLSTRKEKATGAAALFPEKKFIELHQVDQERQFIHQELGFFHQIKAPLLPHGIGARIDFQMQKEIDAIRNPVYKIEKKYLMELNEFYSPRFVSDASELSPLIAKIHQDFVREIAPFKSQAEQIIQHIAQVVEKFGQLNRNITREKIFFGKERAFYLEAKIFFMSHNNVDLLRDAERAIKLLDDYSKTLESFYYYKPSIDYELALQSIQEGQQAIEALTSTKEKIRLEMQEKKQEGSSPKPQ